MKWSGYYINHEAEVDVLIGRFCMYIPQAASSDPIGFSADNPVSSAMYVSYRSSVGLESSRQGSCRYYKCKTPTEGRVLRVISPRDDLFYPKNIPARPFFAGVPENAASWLSSAARFFPLVILNAVSGGVGAMTKGLGVALAGRAGRGTPGAWAGSVKA